MRVALNEADDLRMVRTDRKEVECGTRVWYDIIHEREYGTMRAVVGEVQVFFERGKAPAVDVLLPSFPPEVADRVAEVVLRVSA